MLDKCFFSLRPWGYEPSFAVDKQDARDARFSARPSGNHWPIDVAFLVIAKLLMMVTTGERYRPSPVCRPNARQDFAASL